MIVIYEGNKKIKLLLGEKKLKIEPGQKLKFTASELELVNTTMPGMFTEKIKKEKIKIIQKKKGKIKKGGK